jgi:DNA-binding NarL/FixJ family response regulator
MERITVYVYAHDPVLQAGVSSQLRQRPEVAVVGDAGIDTAAVAVVVADEADASIVQAIRAIQRGGCPKVVTVLGRVEDHGVLDVVEAGACGLLRRAEATGDRLVTAIEAASRGDGSVPPDVLGRLLHQVGRLQRQVLAPRGLSFTGLADREVEVLRLVAEGHDTAAIARIMCYSERTVKNIIHDMTARLQLKNRAHAVAYAVREGLI